MLTSISRAFLCWRGSESL